MTKLTYNLKTPSLLYQYTQNHIFEENININNLFWKYIFSIEFYEKYFPNENNKIIIEQIQKAKYSDENIIKYLKDYKKPEILKESHKNFYILINYYNQFLFWKNNIHLSISRNMVVENEENQLFQNILNHILEKINFITDVKYSIKIYFDNEIYSAIHISKYLKEKYNSEIEIDTFTNSDEQVDFAVYSVLEKRDYIDKVITYKNAKQNNLTYFKKIHSNTLINETNSKSIRFFKQACFWNKCAFCTINAQHNNEKCNEDENKTIEKHISFLKDNPNLKYIFFSDEAIEHNTLVKFCKRILEEGIDIRMSVRTRHKKNYNEEDIKIIGNAGVRFMGIGLESASNRLNLLIKKRSFNLEIEQIDKFIDIFNKYNIHLHQYFMIGLPSETKEETDLTYNFILKNLRKRKYFTYSANVFSLNQGSDIFKNPENYGIKIENKKYLKSQGIPFENIEGNRYNQRELTEKSHKIYSYMFFEEEYIQNKINYGYDFWDFLDRTSIFYHQKLIYDENPYIKKN